MAATMTDTGELTYLSFGIDKVESTADGDLMVYGKASDGSVDADQQIVSPSWMAKAVQEWIATGPNVRVQHNAQRDPAGIGLSASTDETGATWVKALIVEPGAQRLVSKGALRAYSVGIARPTIERDVTGKARGGIITNGTLCEVSLVDRPANKSCGIQLVKSADDGSMEYTGKIFGDSDVIAKFTGVDMTKSADVTAPADMSLTFTPADLAKILKTKIIDQHYEELAAKAKESVADPTDTDSNKESTIGDSVADATEVIKETEPQVTKDPEAAEDIAADEEKAAKPKKKGGKKLPPWMNDSKGDDDSDGDDDSSCKEAHAHTEKCTPSGTPQSASGAKDAAPMQEIPNTGPAPESPMPAGRKTPDTKSADPESAALMRFKMIGIDATLGKLHDLTCPAYDPDDVVKYHPYADFSSLIDEDMWMRKAVDAACGPMEKAMEMTQIWEAVQALKGFNPAELNDFRSEAHKAFRDANPGVSSYPSPGSMSPDKLKRPVLSGGHAANSPGYDGPNTSPSVATSPAHAGSFNRPPLTSGHQSPSPSFMKNDMQYPSETGVPVNLTYMHIEKDKARRALSMLHDHLSHQFPLGCPMIEQDAYRQPTATPVPPAAGLGKSVEAPAQEAAVSKSPEVPADVMDAIEKGMRKKLGKKVLSGKMTVDEARSKMGRMRAQKMAEWGIEQQFTKGEISREEALKALGFEVPEPVTKGAAFTPNPDVTPDAAADIQKSLNASSMVNAELIKSAIAEAIAPLVTRIEKQQEVISEHEARWDAAANLGDPKTAGWMGLALNPAVNKSARPVGVPAVAENAERTQAVKRQLNHTWRTSDNAYEREAAWAELAKLGHNE